MRFRDFLNIYGVPAIPAVLFVAVAIATGPSVQAQFHDQDTGLIVRLVFAFAIGIVGGLLSVAVYMVRTGW